MPDKFIFLPVLVQIVLTAFLYMVLIKRKKAAVAAGQVNEERRALHSDGWPDTVIQVNNAIQNQFEIPLLFYVLCFVLFNLAAVDMMALIVAWSFTISRIVHAYIHIEENYVPKRRAAFTVGCLAVFALTALAFKALLL